MFASQDIGASLKDLGKEWFAFSKFEMKSFDILNRLEGCWDKAQCISQK